MTRRTTCLTVLGGVALAGMVAVATVGSEPTAVTEDFGFDEITSRTAELLAELESNDNASRARLANAQLDRSPIALVEMQFVAPNGTGRTPQQTARSSSTNASDPFARRRSIYARSRYVQSGASEGRDGHVSIYERSRSFKDRGSAYSRTNKNQIRRR